MLHAGRHVHVTRTAAGRGNHRTRTAAGAGRDVHVPARTRTGRISVGGVAPHAAGAVVKRVLKRIWCASAAGRLLLVYVENGKRSHGKDDNNRSNDDDSRRAGACASTRVYVAVSARKRVGIRRLGDTCVGLCDGALGVASTHDFDQRKPFCKQVVDLIAGGELLGLFVALLQIKDGDAFLEQSNLVQGGCRGCCGRRERGGGGGGGGRCGGGCVRFRRGAIRCRRLCKRGGGGGGFGRRGGGRGATAGVRAARTVAAQPTHIVRRRCSSLLHVLASSQVTLRERGAFPLRFPRDSGARLVLLMTSSYAYQELQHARLAAHMWQRTGYR